MSLSAATSTRQAQEDFPLARSVAESILASPVVPLRGLSPSKNAESLPNNAANDQFLRGFQELKISSNVESKLPPFPKKEPLSGINEKGQLCMLFIGDLARNVSEAQLHAAFGVHGEIVDIDVKRDKVTANNLGYGFIQFKTREQAASAKAALNGVEIGARKIRLGWAQKNTTLFIGDLDGFVTTQQLQEAFQKYGPIIEDETFVKNGNGKFGFVRFVNRSDAERAKVEMNRRMLGTRAIRIGWGDNNLQKHCVHVQFNPSQGAHLTEDDFRRHFASYGPLLSVSLPRYTNRRLKGYGFIHFEDTPEITGEQAASKVITDMAETNIGNVLVRCSYGKRQVFNRYHRRQTVNQQQAQAAATAAAVQAQAQAQAQAQVHAQAQGARVVPQAAFSANQMAFHPPTTAPAGSMWVIDANGAWHPVQVPFNANVAPSTANASPTSAQPMVNVGGMPHNLGVAQVNVKPANVNVGSGSSGNVNSNSHSPHLNLAHLAPQGLGQSMYFTPPQAARRLDSGGFLPSEQYYSPQLYYRGNLVSYGVLDDGSSPGSTLTTLTPNPSKPSLSSRASNNSNYTLAHSPTLPSHSLRYLYTHASLPSALPSAAAPAAMTTPPSTTTTISALSSSTTGTSTMLSSPGSASTNSASSGASPSNSSSPANSSTVSVASSSDGGADSDST